MAGRYTHLKELVGEHVTAEIHNAHILCVGAGGIGCELLKNLVLVGFKNIQVIDLDTIDVSNLNRQFLFRSKHVGMPKSTVAQEAALEFNKDVDIKAYMGNIKESKFGLDYFRNFDVVLNALDNVNARQHVNRLCLAADIPLIDSGTTGYLGQTAVIKKGETQCYDCQPKSDNKKTFPICTIRNTPEKPVHCIVWAKELFKLLFGRMEESMLSGSEEDISLEPKQGGDEDDGGGDGGDDKAAMQQQEFEVRSKIQEAATRPTGAAMDDQAKLREYARGVFDAVFNVEIQLKLRMRNGYKGAKKKPAPLSHKDALADDSSSRPGEAAAMSDQRIMSLKECAELFESCVLKMWAPDRRGTIGDAEFDKDDDLSLDFVTAASNLRSHVFSIERKSKFDTKGIAGNIIHAIATTNAIVAGAQVIEAIKLLSKIKRKPLKCGAAVGEQGGEKVTQNSTCVYVVREPVGRGFLLQPTACSGPNNDCVTCGKALVHLTIDTSKATLGFLLEKVIKLKFGINEPTIMLGTSELYAEGEGLEEDEIEDFQSNLAKTLEACPAGGIKHDTMLSVEDLSQDFKFEIAVRHKSNKDFEDEENADYFTVGGDTPVVGKETQSKKQETPEKAKSDDVQIMIVEDVASSGSSKRSREEEDANDGKSKKAKVVDDDDVIEIS